MQGVVGLGGFQFKDDLILHNYIRPIRGLEFETFISKRNLNFRLRFYAAYHQLTHQCCLICVFQQSRAQLPMHLYRCSYNAVAQFIYLIYIHLLGIARLFFLFVFGGFGGLGAAVLELLGSLLADGLRLLQVDGRSPRIPSLLLAPVLLKRYPLRIIVY